MKLRSKFDWFNLYNVCHQNPVNIAIHKVCVPVIVYTVTGLLWLIPDPGFWPSSLPSFYALASLMAVLVFYSTWGDLRLIALSVVLYVIPNLLLWSGLSNVAPNLVTVIAVSGFALAWIGQFIGHYIEGKKPSFFDDLQFLLIGPAWILSRKNP